MKKIFIIVGAIIFIGVIAIISNSFNSIKIKRNIELKKALREELMGKITDNEMTVDENGRVLLTEGYNNIAVNNYVRIFICNREEKVVAFLYRAGFPDNEQYIFYSSSDEQLIKKYVQEYKYETIEKIDDHWFLVAYN